MHFTLRHFEVHFTLRHVEVHFTLRHVEVHFTLRHVEVHFTPRHFEVQFTPRHFEIHFTIRHFEMHFTIRHFEVQWFLELNFSSSWVGCSSTACQSVFTDMKCSSSGLFWQKIPLLVKRSHFVKFLKGGKFKMFFFFSLTDSKIKIQNFMC